MSGTTVEVRKEASYYSLGHRLMGGKIGPGSVGGTVMHPAEVWLYEQGVETHYRPETFSTHMWLPPGFPSVGYQLIEAIQTGSPAEVERIMTKIGEEDGAQ